jgi:outer membrane protein OmpA-like peptidoglycan-associated protein
VIGKSKSENEIAREEKKKIHAFLIFCVCALAVLALQSPAQAEKYKPDDPIPPGATGKVLPLHGKVTDLKGMSSAVAGKVDALNAALKDLGARATDTEIQIELSSDVLFDFDKSDLRPLAIPSLLKVVTVMQSYPAYVTTIGGHTDGKGGKEYNQKLSERRANSVKTWLVGHGASNPMNTQGFGDTKPVAPNTKPNGSDDPEGRQKNRRVEITLKRH